MAQQLKPLVLHSFIGPTPWKTALLLAALDLPVETKMHTPASLHEPAFLAINPSGQAPALHDPNTGITLAESGAIADYLLEQYDGAAHRLSFAAAPERWALKQWIAFQNASHNPSLSGVFYFTVKEPEPAVRAVFVRRTRAVWEVLERGLAGKQWLVGGRCSAADLNFMPLQDGIELFMKQDMPDMSQEFPSVKAWLGRMGEMEVVKSVLAQKQRARAAAMQGNK